MLTSKKPYDFASWVGCFTLVFGYLGVAHFVFGLYLTLRLAHGFPEYRLCFLGFSLPYIAITAVFVASVVFAHRGQVRRSLVLLVFGLLVSVAACVYDFKNYRYQLGGGGIGATYTIWWWYYEPFWHDYKPGNV